MYPLPALHDSDAGFAAIRDMADFYVDKMGLLRELLATVPVRSASPHLRDRHLFWVRLRRFGKALLVSTLEAWFQGLLPCHVANPVGLTVQLDGMPAGGTSPPWLWDDLAGADWHGVHGWHPVIRLDLSLIDCPDPAGTRTAPQT